MAVVASGVLPIEQVANKNLALVAQAIFPNWLYVISVSYTHLDVYKSQPS